MRVLILVLGVLVVLTGCAARKGGAGSPQVRPVTEGDLVINEIESSGHAVAWHRLGGQQQSGAGAD